MNKQASTTRFSRHGRGLFDPSRSSYTFLVDVNGRLRDNLRDVVTTLNGLYGREVSNAMVLDVLTDLFLETVRRGQESNKHEQHT